RRRRMPARRARTRSAPGSTRLVLELLPADACFVHQATLGHGERRHALVVAAGRGGVLLAAAGARRRAGGAGAGVGRGGNRDGAGFGAELEVAAREFLERALVFEED